jgi:hypothetical protein
MFFFSIVTRTWPQPAETAGLPPQWRLPPAQPPRLPYHQFFLELYPWVGPRRVHPRLCLQTRRGVNAIKLFLMERINCKQSIRWQHLCQLKASTFLMENYFVGCCETQELILEIGNRTLDGSISDFLLENYFVRC